MSGIGGVAQGLWNSAADLVEDGCRGFDTWFKNDEVCLASIGFLVGGSLIYEGVKTYREEHEKSGLAVAAAGVALVAASVIGGVMASKKHINAQVSYSQEKMKVKDLENTISDLPRKKKNLEYEVLFCEIELLKLADSRKASEPPKRQCLILRKEMRKIAQRAKVCQEDVRQHDRKYTLPLSI